MINGLIVAAFGQLTWPKCVCLCVCVRIEQLWVCVWVFVNKAFWLTIFSLFFSVFVSSANDNRNLSFEENTDVLTARGSTAGMAVSTYPSGWCSGRCSGRRRSTPRRPSAPGRPLRRWAGSSFRCSSWPGRCRSCCHRRLHLRCRHSPGRWWPSTNWDAMAAWDAGN